MDNIDYYKSLISDEEVIKALIKESKAREGELSKEKTRVRPNLNFFQRTVTNLVSSNKRITTTPEFIPKERSKYIRKVKTPHTLMREILMTNKINFVKSEESKNTEHRKRYRLTGATEENQGTDNSNKNFDRTGNDSKSLTGGSIHFNLNFDKNKFVNNASTSINENLPKHEKHEQSTSSDSSDSTVISISSTQTLSSLSSSFESDVISISDSDSNSTKPEQSRKRELKSGKICKKKCKKKVVKKNAKNKRSFLIH
ncbi:hypothetical protein NQ314_016593 [Rhamnusium bicolor]|uniref:Uncharacterized protein n=1 Tax=Rhamnusium bicolor TaxID=1586634 RepID=A0AAV8WY90_9CUCU|nr:hypothetical protein NQ314_016593 [Rhamnusium bicolor]